MVTVEIWVMNVLNHAAALGTFGLTSNRNVATRWIHHNFDASACFDGCSNIAEILERLQRTCISRAFLGVLCVPALSLLLSIWDIVS